jgi:hypothetical protein
MDADAEHYLQTLYKDLAFALGDAVWSFAQIEWLTYEYLRSLSADRLDELVSDATFRTRTSMLRHLIERKDAASAKTKRALAAISAAEALAERRNIIVHNPWRVWVDLDAKDFMTQIQKYSNRGKAVDLTQLREFTQSATRVESELREAIDAL